MFALSVNVADLLLSLPAARSGGRATLPRAHFPRLPQPSYTLPDFVFLSELSLSLATPHPIYSVLSPLIKIDNE